MDYSTCDFSPLEDGLKSYKFLFQLIQLNPNINLQQITHWIWFCCADLFLDVLYRMYSLYGHE